MIRTRTLVGCLALGACALGLAFHLTQRKIGPGDGPFPTRTKPVPVEPRTIAAEPSRPEAPRDLFPLVDLLEEPDDARAVLLYRQRLSTLALDEFPQAIRHLLNRTYTERRELLAAALLKQWTALDPAGALASEIARASKESKYISLILANWAEVSPLDLWTWARHADQLQADPSLGIPASKAFAAAMKALIDRKDFSLASTLSLEWGGSVGQLIVAWSATDFSGASRWTLSLPPGPNRTQAIGGLVHNISLSEPDLAVTILTQLSRPDEIVSAVQGIMGATRAPLSGPSGTVVLTRLVELAGQDRNGVYDAIIPRILMLVAPDESFSQQTAQALLTQIKDPRQRTLATSFLISKMAQASPLIAASLVFEFMEVPKQGDALRPVMESWAGKDRRSAMDFAENDSRIPPDLRPKLIEWVKSASPTP